MENPELRQLAEKIVKTVLSTKSDLDAYERVEEILKKELSVLAADI